MAQGGLLMPSTLQEVRIDTKTRTILDISQLTFDFRPTLLLGANGAGKSTLMQVLTGERQPTAGVVHNNGTLAFVEQQFRPIIGFTCLEYCAYAAWLRGQDRRVARENALAWLEFVSLEQLASQRCQHLSGGEEARLAIATALNSGAETLLLDEPSAALDPLHKDQITQVYQRIVAAGHALVVSTHDAGEIQDPFQRVLVLDQGKLCFDGSCAEFLAAAYTAQHPAQALAQSFLRRRGHYAT